MKYVELLAGKVDSLAVWVEGDPVPRGLIAGLVFTFLFVVLPLLLAAGALFV